ncbi:MAG: hypothetical protein E7265_06520 [Lachnospiraceae bacterium]|nr:hypothetical protein [Lachnospiraceae bacterium]
MKSNVFRRAGAWLLVVTMLMGMCLGNTSIVSADKNDRKASAKTVKAYLYYRYSNEVPDTITFAENNVKYGPNSNGVSSVEVTVDLAALEELGYARGKYTEGFIYSVENENNTVNYEAAGTHNENNVLKDDSTVRAFWDDLYSCMDDASKELIKETFDGKFVGYVIKNTGSRDCPVHIDGIMDVDVIPTYQTELYDITTSEKVLARTSTSNVKEKYSNVYTMVEDYLKESQEDFSIDWISETEAVYIKDGKTYELTMTQKRPANTVIPSKDEDIVYRAYTNLYNVAEFNIVSKKTSYDCVVNIYHDKELLKTYSSNNLQAVNSGSVTTYSTVKKYIENYLLDGARYPARTYVDWAEGVYCKDGVLYEFTVETTSPTQGDDDTVVLPIEDKKGTIYYSAPINGKEYVSDIVINDKALDVIEVGLYVLKAETTNIVYGYDVDNNSILQHPTTEFYPFGYAYVDRQYVEGLTKLGKSSVKGETITEILLTYNSKDDTFEAVGEKYETGKIVRYLAFDSTYADMLVEKINGDYNIMWYVIKKAGADGTRYPWHIDGYLCNDDSKDEKIKVTVNHKIYNPETESYELMNIEGNEVTETVPVCKLYESKAKFPAKPEVSKTKISIDGQVTDWESLPSYWVTAENKAQVQVESSTATGNKADIANYSLVKMYNDDDAQNVYVYMKASDKYDTFFRTDNFKLSVNGSENEVEFKVGDANGNIINGDISSMEPGIYSYYLYNKDGVRISNASAKLIIASNHLNTSIEMSIPYDILSEQSDTKYYFTGFEKESGTVVEELSSYHYDDDKLFVANSQLGYEDTVLSYRYSARRTVESIKFETINIEGTPTAPYVIVMIGFAFALAGIYMNRKHAVGRK